jgi:hypothetical protein
MKKAKTLVQQAIEAVPEFGQSYEKFRNMMLAHGKSVESINNYSRKLAVIVLRFQALPETLTAEQVNTHLAEMRSRNLSLSEYKHTIFGLRNYHKALGIRRRAVRLPSVRKDGSLPVVLSQKECRRLFAAPSNRLLLNDVRLAVGQQPVERVSRKERRQAVQQRLGYFPCRCPACGMDTLVVIEKILPGRSPPYPAIPCTGVC